MPHAAHAAGPNPRGKGRGLDSGSDVRVDVSGLDGRILTGHVMRTGRGDFFWSGSKERRVIVGLDPAMASTPPDPREINDMESRQP